jgi:hypothetical protein
LKEYGKPTIIVCDIPLSDISDEWLASLVRMSKNELLSQCSIHVNQVEPENIIDFIYPTNWVIDPFTFARYKLS